MRLHTRLSSHIDRCLHRCACRITPTLRGSRASGVLGGCRMSCELSSVRPVGNFTLQHYAFSAVIQRDAAEYGAVQVIRDVRHDIATAGVIHNDVTLGPGGNLLNTTHQSENQLFVFHTLTNTSPLSQTQY